MKYKHKRICKSLVSLLLIITFILAPFEDVFAGKEAQVNGNTDADAVDSGDTNGDGVAPLVGQAVIIGMLEIDNTALEYSNQITAHNQALPEGSNDYWSEYRVSITDQYLYSHPHEMSDIYNVDRCALIRLIKSSESKSNKQYKALGQRGTRSTKTYQGTYYAVRKSGSQHSSYNVDVVFSKVKNNDAYYEAFKSGSLDADLVMALADQNKSALEGGVNDFVALWEQSGDVDDCLNKFVSQEADSYGNALRYLDFLLIINKLCGNSYPDLIKKYLKKLNRDESDTFITVCAAAAVMCKIDSSSNKYAATLPNYYSAITGEDFDSYQTFSFNSSFPSPVEPGTGGYNADSSGFINSLKSQYDGVGRAVYLSCLQGGNKDIFWWVDSEYDYKMGWMLQPTDINGNATGNTGYTFLGVPGWQTVPVPDDEKDPDPDPDPDDGGDLANDAYAKFYISASSEEYEVMPGDTVAARIDINLKQSAQMLYDLKLKWTANGIKYRDWDPSFGIALVREGGGSDIAIETMTSNPSNSGGLDPAMQSSTQSGFTVMDVSWEEALEIFNGRKSVTVYDENVTINSDKEQRYVAIVTLYWFYDNANVGSATAATMSFYSSGKEIVTEYQGADEVPWIVRKDDPNQGHFYSQIRDGNYVEMKDNSPGNGETYEAMAGVPTTENLYAGFGANEFMVNMECELKSDTGMQRKYTLTSTRMGVFWLDKQLSDFFFVM